MKNLINFLNESKNTRFAKIAKKCVKNQGNDWDDDAYFDSADMWMEDENIFSDEAIEAIWNVMASISDGDDPKKYQELAEKYWK